jgi:anti-sigma factor RsiW
MSDLTGAGGLVSGDGLSKESMLELMAYADGELDGDDLTRIEMLIASNPEAERVVSSMHTLGDCLRVTEGERRIPKIVDRIADDVMAVVATAAKAAKARQVVVPLAPRPVRVRNAIVAGTVSAAIAVAAGWSMFVQAPEPVPAAPLAIAVTAPPVTATASAPAVTPNATPDGTGVDLNEVESPAQVSVFYVPAVAAGEVADENVSSVVLWLGDDGKGK